MRKAQISEIHTKEYIACKRNEYELSGTELGEKSSDHTFPFIFIFCIQFLRQKDNTKRAKMSKQQQQQQYNSIYEREKNARAHTHK